MIYQSPFRSWTVEVSDDLGFAGDHYKTFWRSTIRMDKPCELFTIVSEQNPDDALVQLLLFEDGSIQAWSWYPTMIQSHPAERCVVIGMLKPEDAAVPIACLESAQG